MVLRSPLGRLLSFLFSLGIAAIIYFAVIKDKTDEAEKQSSGGDNPTQAGKESLFKAANFTKALTKLRAKESAGAPMLKIQVLPGQAEFQVRKGEKADGYRYNAKNGELQSVKVEIVGSGTLEGADYSLRRVAPDVTERLDRALRERNKELHPTVMTLERGITGGGLKWTINADGGGRTGIVFNARPDGSGLADPAAFAGGARGGSGSDAVSKARKQQDCVLKAGNNAKQIQACLK